MPIVKITLPNDKPQKFQEDLIEIIESSIVDLFQVTADKIITSVTEINNFKQTQALNKTVLIEIIAYKGRSVEIRSKLLKTIHEKINKLYTTNKNELVIYLLEIEKENYFCS